MEKDYELYGRLVIELEILQARINEVKSRIAQGLNKPVEPKEVKEVKEDKK